MCFNCNNRHICKHIHRVHSLLHQEETNCTDPQFDHSDNNDLENDIEIDTTSRIQVVQISDGWFIIIIIEYHIILYLQ